MTRSRWVLAASLVLGGAFALAMDGCDGDDTPAKTLPVDSGNPSDTLPPGDSSLDVIAPPDSGAHAKILLVHASPDVPAVRVCFAVGTKADGSDAVVVPIPPLPDRINGADPYPGVFPGTGGAFPDLGVDLSTKVIVPYVIIASAVKDDVRSDAGPPKLQCAELLGNGPNALPGTAYLKLPLLPAGTLASGKTLLLAATGCLPNEPQGAALCGASYDAIIGNVALGLYELDTKVVASSTQVGAQLLHLASPVEGKLQAPMSASILGPDASIVNGEPITSSAHFGDLAPKTAAVVALADPTHSALFVSIPNPDAGAPLANVAVPLPLVYQITTGESIGVDQYFKGASNLVFVAVGDPTEPTFLDAGTFNGKSLHFLAFPSDPPVKSYP